MEKYYIGELQKKVETAPSVEHVSPPPKEPIKQDNNFLTYFLVTASIVIIALAIVIPRFRNKN